MIIWVKIGMRGSFQWLSKKKKKNKKFLAREILIQDKISNQSNHHLAEISVNIIIA